MKYHEDIKVGASVAFASTFLRSIGCFTGDVPQDRGTVTDMSPVGDNAFCVVNFDIQGETRVLASNLWPADKMHTEPR